jgi:hypothetical protein
MPRRPTNRSGRWDGTRRPRRVPMDPTPGRLETPSKGDPSDWMSARCRWGSSAEPPCSGKGAAAWPFMMRRDRSSRSARFARQRLKESAWPSVTTSPSRPASADWIRSCAGVCPVQSLYHARRAGCRQDHRGAAVPARGRRGWRTMHLCEPVTDRGRVDGDRAIARLDTRRHPDRRVIGVGRGQRRGRPDDLPDR